MKKFLIAAALPLAAGNSQMLKVVELLQKMSTTLKEEQAADKVKNQQNREQCAKHNGRLTAEIAESERMIDKTAGQMESAKMLMASAKSQIPDLTSTSANAAQTQKEASKNREAEKATFNEVSKDLVETVSMLDRATTILKSQGESAFLQKDMRKVAKTLGLIVSSSSISTANRDRLTSLIQEAKIQKPRDQDGIIDRPDDEDPDEDEDDSFLQEAPQATTSAYESKSGNIIQVLQDMKSQAEEQLSSARQAETTAQHAFEMMYQKLSNEIKNAEQGIKQLKAEAATAAEDLAQATGDHEMEVGSLSQNQGSLKALTHQCTQFQKNFENRVATRDRNINGLDQAVGILSGRFGFVQKSVSLLQTRTALTDVRERVASMLQSSAEKFKDLQLAEVSQRLKEGNGPFDKIIKMIEGLVAKLKKRQSDEAGEFAFCQEEQSKNNAKLETKTAEFKKLSARLDKSVSQIASLTEEITQTRDELAELNQQLAEADAQRADSKAKFTEADTELSGNIEALTAALAALNEAGIGGGEEEGAALVQQKAGADDFGLDESGITDVTDAGSGPLGVIQTARQDAEATLDQLRRDEAAEAESYRNFSNEAKVAKASKEAALKQLDSNLASTKSRLPEVQEDVKRVTEELDAVNKVKASLAKRCTAVPMSHQEKQRKRQEEIDNLKTALEVLASHSGGTSFLQRALRD